MSDLESVKKTVVENKENGLGKADMDAKYSQKIQKG
jgi:hypothetical protein